MGEISFNKYTSLLLRNGIDMLNREVSIIGDIKLSTFVKFDRQLKMLETNKEDITVVLNSIGGSVVEALAIVDRIRNSPCTIDIVATGAVMSAALSILASGHHRKATKYTNFMHHGLSQSTSGHVSETIPQIENELKASKDLDRVRFKHLAECTKKPYSFWASAGKHVDHIFSADQALEYGLIDEIV